MMADELNRLIANGLRQPTTEPTFFLFPSGYDLVSSGTSYNLTPVQQDENLEKPINAQLEPNT